MQIIPPQNREQQLAQIKKQAEEAVASALAVGDPEARSAMTEELETHAQQVERLFEGEFRSGYRLDRNAS